MLPTLAALVLQTNCWFDAKHFPPDPRLPWAPPAIALANREGLLTWYPEMPWRQRGPASRYEYAVAIHAAATIQFQRAEAFLAHPTNELDRASIVRCAVLLPFYKRAEKEFKKELVSLGIADDFGQARLSEITRQIAAKSPARDLPFRDVPSDHWAAKAVGDLRALGLLDGYPDGTYKGSR